MMSEILVMDCEEREAFWLTLKSDCKILFSATAEKGLSMLSENVGLVFLSMRLPDMNSMEVFRRIKREYPSTAVIVITSGGTRETDMETSERESRDQAGKPLKAEEILQEIKALLHTGDDTSKSGQMSLSTETVQDEFYPDVPSHVLNGVLRVRDFLAQNCSASLSLAAACKMAGTSKTYFCHYFKHVTGHSLRNYHHVVKVQRAEEFLRDKRLSVKDIAHKLGYHDANYFSTIYRKMTGAPPRHRQAYGRTQESEKEEVGIF